MRVTFSPRVVVPLVFGFGLILLLLNYANVGRVAHAAGGFQPAYLLAIMLLIVGYEALRAVQWLLFLRVLDRDTPWRIAVMSYMGGEMAKMLPGGQYFQTYLLRQARGVAIARSAAATSIILWFEVIVCLIVVLVLGVGPWTWLRPTALILLCGIAIGIMTLRHRRLSARLRAAASGNTRLLAAWRWYDTFAVAAIALLRPRVLGAAIALSAGYILCAAVELWAIAAARGVRDIGPGQALVAYAFALGLGMLVIIPIDLGLVELGGLAVLIALGVGRADALTIMLVQRVLNSILTSGIAAGTLAALRRHMAAVMQVKAETDVAVSTEPPLTHPRGLA